AQAVPGLCQRAAVRATGGTGSGDAAPLSRDPAAEGAARRDARDHTRAATAVGGPTRPGTGPAPTRPGGPADRARGGDGRKAGGAAGRGHGHVVLIVGEAGIGKSRLLVEVAAEVRRGGGRVLLGRCYESEQILPFGPWVDAFRAGHVIGNEVLLGRVDPAWRA